MNDFEAGRSVQGRAIRAYQSVPEEDGRPARWMLLLGQVHGDEPQGRWLLRALKPEWERRHPCDGLGLVVVPCLNPDGGRARTRVNANGVDLNRNMPTRDWKPGFERPGNNPGASPASEPETQAVLRLMQTYDPVAILSIHSMKRFQINCNGPALEWGRALADVCGYPVTDDIGYPCPGSLGTYAGAERQIPTITLEVDSRARMPAILEAHLPVLREAVRWWGRG